MAIIATGAAQDTGTYLTDATSFGPPPEIKKAKSTIVLAQNTCHDDSGGGHSYGDSSNSILDYAGYALRTAVAPIAYVVFLFSTPWQFWCAFAAGPIFVQPFTCAAGLTWEWITNPSAFSL